MIVSASYKTDIPAFYGEWFQARLAAGRCLVENPYGGRPFTITLDPESVAGFVFWTRNPAPFLSCLSELHRGGRPFVVQFTVTGYPRVLDAGTISSQRAIAILRNLSNKFGDRVCVWRYDPIVITEVTPPQWHRQNFATLADHLAGAVDEVVVSFVQIYRKTQRNLDVMTRNHGIAWHDPASDQKCALLSDLTTIATDRGLRLTLCGQPELLGVDTAEARCIDGYRLADIAGHEMDLLDKAHRKNCACHASHDIGAYDTCTHGCVYCYAVRNRDAAKARLASHNPAGEFLVPAREMVTSD